MENAAKKLVVSTHSRPKAADHENQPSQPDRQRFNTQPPEGGCSWAARGVLALIVSTHSRPKAAVDKLNGILVRCIVSTHSRPKAAGSNTSFTFPA